MVDFVVKLLLALWPFIREMIMGKKGTSEYARRNKSMMIAIILNILQTFVIFFLIDLSISISQELSTYKKTNDAHVVNLTVENKIQLSRIAQLEEEVAKLQNSKFLQYENEFVPRPKPAQEDSRRGNINDRLNRLGRD